MIAAMTSPDAVDDAPVASSAPTRAGWAVIASRSLLTLALLGVWALIYLFGLSGLEESRAQHALYATLRTELAGGTAPVSDAIGGGAPIALLDIPRAGVKDLVVVQGSSAAELQSGPGHLRGTPLPGQAGVSVVLGRAVTYGGPFRHLDALRPGDQIIVVTGQGTFRYSVLGVRTGRAPTPSAPAGTGALTLVTAAHAGALGQVSSEDVLSVDARLQGAAQPATIAAAPAPIDERPLATDHSATTRFELVLALQLLALALVGSVWAYKRWGRAEVWLAGVPAVLAATWLVSDVATRLLPNLL